MLVEGVPAAGEAIARAVAWIEGRAGHKDGFATVSGRLYEYVACVNRPFTTAAAEETRALQSWAPLELNTATVQPFTSFMASTSEAWGVEPAPWPSPWMVNVTAAAAAPVPGSMMRSHGLDEHGQRTQPPQAPWPDHAVDATPSMV